MRLVDTSIEIAAPRERVWDLFTTTGGLCSWMAIAADVDLRPGGSWRWVHENGDSCSGEYLAIDPPDSLSFTYGWESGTFDDVAPGSTTVDVSLVETGTGTLVSIVHTGLVGDRVDHHRVGWGHFLGELAAVASASTKTNHDEGSR